MSLGAQLELGQAECSIESIAEDWGDSFDLYLEGEDTIIRDKYNGIKSKSFSDKITLISFTTINSPSQDQMNKAGIFQRVDLLLTVSTNSLKEKEISLSDIDTLRATIVWDNQTWIIKEKGTSSNFAGISLYTTLGLVKK